MSINRVVLVGNLTRDPEMKTTNSGTNIAKLRVAVNDLVKDQATGEWADKANYFDVDVFGKQAELCGQYLTRGRQVAVDGRLSWREWEAKDGTKRQAVSVKADTVQFIGPRETTMDEARDMAKAAGLLKGAAVDEDDDIPFDEGGR